MSFALPHSSSFFLVITSFGVLVSLFRDFDQHFVSAKECDHSHHDQVLHGREHVQLEPEVVVECEDGSETEMKSDGRQGEGERRHVDADRQPEDEHHEDRGQAEQGEEVGHEGGGALLRLAEQVTDFGLGAGRSGFIHGSRFGECQGQVGQVPRHGVANNRIADDQVDLVLAALASELLGLGTDIKVELVDLIGVWFSHEDDFGARLGVRESDKGLVNSDLLVTGLVFERELEDDLVVVIGFQSLRQLLGVIDTVHLGSSGLVGISNTDLCASDDHRSERLNLEGCSRVANEPLVSL